jgi:hypothetical protein
LAKKYYRVGQYLICVAQEAVYMPAPDPKKFGHTIRYRGQTWGLMRSMDPPCGQPDDSAWRAYLAGAATDILSIVIELHTDPDPNDEDICAARSVRPRNKVFVDPTPTIKMPVLKAK